MLFKLASLETVALIAFWGVVSWRLVVLRSHWHHQKPTAMRPHMLAGWSAIIGAALVAILTHSQIESWVNAQIGEVFVSLIRRIACAVVYLAFVYIFFESAPLLRPRWNWPLIAWGLTFVVNLLAALSTLRTDLPPQAVSGSLEAARATFNLFILWLSLRFVAPVIRWSFRNERQQAMRLRFCVMEAVPQLAAFWMSLVLIAEVFGAGSDHPLLKPIFQVIFTVAITLFIFGYLVPATIFVRLAQGLNSLQGWLNFFFISFLERQIIHWTGRRPIPVHPTVKYSPTLATYQSIITIVDSLKLLQAHSSEEARRLAEQIKAVSDPETDYEASVHQLHQIGKVQWRTACRGWVRQGFNSVRSIFSRSPHTFSYTTQEEDASQTTAKVALRANDISPEGMSAIEFMIAYVRECEVKSSSSAENY